MSEEVKACLEDRYSKLNKKDRNKYTAIKYQYNYKNSSKTCGVDVALYFDAYDRHNPNLIMVLKASEYNYFTSLNVNGIQNHNQYLPNIPCDLLKQVKKDGVLKDFYDVMKSTILNQETKYDSINYQDDKNLNEAKKKFKCGDGCEMFFHTLRKSKMSDEMYRLLKTNTCISQSIIDAIRKAGFTVVRTNDITKRKDIISGLKSHGIL